MEDVATPAHVSAVQGRAIVEREGRAEAVTENLPLLVGDRLRTEAGRLEVLLPDGSALALDADSTVDLLAGGLMRLLGGRMVLVVSRPADGEPRRDYQVDARAGTVRFLTSGEYRVSVVGTGGAPGVEAAVVRGQAALDAGGSSVRLSAGERATAEEGQGIASPRPFNSASTDAFYVWADQLRSERVGSQSNAYLPSDLQVYGGTFDRDGSWDSLPDYGDVWYPRVAPDWRPYYDGAWQAYGWGWTFVGAGRWVWPTHHYGRWGHGARGWFWMPSAAWGPGWVSWGMATDYVAWCPLGLNDSPVFGFLFGLSTGWHSDPWRGWTVAPQHAFGRGGRVPSYALRGDHLKAVEPSRFAIDRTGPAGSGTAVSRGPAQSFGSSYGRAQSVAGARERGTSERAPMAGGVPLPVRPGVSQRSWSADESSAYGRAQSVAGARERGTSERAPMAGSVSLPVRPGVSQRSGSADSPSPHMSEQAVAAERLRRIAPAPTAAPHRDATEPFATPSRTPLPYPDRFRSPAASERREPGPAAAPRSETSRSPAAQSRSPNRPQPASDPRTTSAPAAGGGRLPSPGSHAAPGASTAPRSGLPSPGIGTGRTGGSSAPQGSAGSGGRSSGSAPARGGGGGGGGRRK
jgi:hypothetical protein